MAEISQTNVQVWKKTFRRTKTVSELRSLATALASEAAEVVTITSTSMEGGAAAGTVTGNKLELLAAVEELLAEQDGDAAAATAAGAPLRMIYPAFSIGHIH
jgi:hypothetical protein